MILIVSLRPEKIRGLSSQNEMTISLVSSEILLPGFFLLSLGKMPNFEWMDRPPRTRYSDHWNSSATIDLDQEAGAKVISSFLLVKLVDEKNFVFISVNNVK